ncbi:MAG: hypothetical protein AAF423_00530 [Pseudomonadota bacterium]
MNNKNICLELIAAESEKEVDDIIASDDVFVDSHNWRPLDGRETNFNVTGNQASDGGKALTELMTNMVDAVLLKHAHQKGVKPKSPSAPQTMYDAVDELVKNMRGGKLVNLDSRDPWLKDFAQKNLVIGITGAKSKRQGLPCYTFVDNGEGQHPDDFKDTFLSLSAGNKKSIPFVQGKFNMGSSGVLSYCGRNWYKLIVSRKHDGSGDWGWTLMRRRPGNRNDMPIAEYFVGPDAKIPSFTAPELYPFNTVKGDRYDGVHIKCGCIIKLYDYQVGARFLSFRGSRESLNENLIETILPFRILDLRQTPDPKRGGDRAKGVDPRPFYGMEFLLLNSHKEEEADDEDEAAGESRVFVGSFSDPNLGEVTISAIHLKRELPGWLKKSNNRVFHAVNGQVQFKQSRGYLSQSCGFPALKDRVVVVVDASGLSFAGHNEVWKGDREHIRNTVDGETYRELVTKTIRESEALKELQQKVAQEELEKASKAESNSLFQKLVDQDANLAGLLSSRDPSIRLPSSGGDSDGSEGGPQEWTDGKFSPTFVRLEEKFAHKALEIPENLSRPLVARTDAENGYLQRPDYRGRIMLTDEVREVFAVREHLKDGRLTIYLTPVKEKLTIGDTISFRIELFDEAMAEPVSTEEVTVKIVEPQKKQKPPPPPPPDPDPEPDGGEGGNKTGKGKPAPTHGLPKCVLLTKDGREVPGYGTEKWPDDFSETDGGMIAELGEEVVYKINYDNSYHLKYRLQQRGSVARDVVTEKYILGMRILLLGYQHAFASQQSKSDGDESGVAEYVDEFRRMAARASASTVLALAENLPKIVDASSINEEDVE